MPTSNPLVIGGKSETSIDYRLHDVNGQWRVYDMVIEDVSTSATSAQFDARLRALRCRVCLRRSNSASPRIQRGSFVYCYF
jgi:ABC-type transporter MlaC component